MANPLTHDNSPLSRRGAVGGLLVTAAGALLGGCAGVAKRTEAVASIDDSDGFSPKRGAFIMRADGTRQFRNHELVDQDGRIVRFQDDLVEGRIFGATFQYAKCNGICADMTNQMRRAYDLMRPIMGNPAQFYMFSLAGDSPAVMKEYMQARGVYGLPGWHFLSGSDEAITDIRWAFGFGDRNEDVDRNLAAHTGMIRFGNHRLDKWAGCPAQGSPEATARLMVRMFPSTERPHLPQIASKLAAPIHPIKGWTPAAPQGSELALNR